jgi:hypothetical protein
MAHHLYGYSTSDDDPDYRDFIDSISVSKEELDALVNVPELQSVQQARDYVRSDSRRIAGLRAYQRVWREVELIGSRARGHIVTVVYIAAEALRGNRKHRHT